MKEQNIIGEDWDNLIILDACRYDFLEKVYKDYLPGGKLEKRRSRGSSTLEWLKNNFTAKYDITYVSANVFVNSYGIPLNKLRPSCRYPWKATEHFSKIVDVWHFSWDETLGTIRPEEVNRAYLSNKGKDDNRKIIHYAQPHIPYLSFARGVSAPARERILRNEKTRPGWKIASRSVISRLSRRLRGLVQPMALRVIGTQNVWRLKEILRMEPGSYFERAWREVDIRGLQHYYEDNLRKVLESISHLMSELEGRTVITADHGEAFGEAGIFGHHLETHIPALLEVPWLVIEKPRKSRTAARKAERERVRAKAEKLKQSGRLYKPPQNPLDE